MKKKRIFSEEALRNIREAAAKRRGIKKGPHTEEVKKKISNATKGKKKNITKDNPGWFKKGYSPKNKGIPHTKDARLKMSIAKKGKPSPKKGKPGIKWTEERKKSFGEKSKVWTAAYWHKKRKTFIASPNTRCRQWSKKIRDRDGKCMECGSTKRLQAHHIIGWNEDITLRYDLENGITLCQRCHLKKHPAWNKGKKLSKEHRIKLSKSHKGNIPWNKGRKYCNVKSGNITVT